jgi:hypothetical protein
MEAMREGAYVCSCKPRIDAVRVKVDRPGDPREVHVDRTATLLARNPTKA